MRKIVFLTCVTVISLILACTQRQQIPDAFVGTWQSDEALTMASLEDSNSVTSADMEIFSDEFFGNRVLDYKALEFRAYWVGEDWNDIEQDLKWYPYDVVASGRDFMTLRYPATEYSDADEKTWRVEGEFIYVEEPKWDFREYYRRIEK